MKILADCARMHRAGFIEHPNPCCGICFGSPDAIVIDETNTAYAICCRTLVKVEGKYGDAISVNNHVRYYAGVIGKPMSCMFGNNTHED